MNSSPILYDEYLTDVEHDSPYSEYINFYIFINTQARTNTELANYLFELGWHEKSDTYIFRSSLDTRNIYQLLSLEAKKR